MTVILILIKAHRTVSKGLEENLEELEIKGRIETIQTTALLKPARILWRVYETWGDLLSFRLKRKTTCWYWFGKLWKSQIIIIIMKMTVIPVVVGAFGMGLQCLEKRLEKWYIKGRIETIQTRALLRSARILRVLFKVVWNLVRNGIIIIIIIPNSICTNQNLSWKMRPLKFSGITLSRSRDQT